MNIQTPYFLIDKEELEKNVNTFSNALQKYWPNSIFSYSVKTNSLPWVLEFMHSKKIRAEVVSDQEYQLSKLCGFSDDQIVYNGPIKGNDQLESALKGKAIINIDSEHELMYILENYHLVSDNIGVRVNVPTHIFKKEDIGYEEDGFRFGFSDETGRLEKVINDLKKVGISKFGLHFHVNSVSRSNDVYSSISKYAKNIINKYQLAPSYIDIGGGFFGGLPTKPSAESYIATIREELEDVVDINTTKLIIEPGSAIIGSCVELYSSVLDLKETQNVEIVTTDASRLHIDPLWKKQNYFYRIEKMGNESLNSGKDKLICGYTCMDHDRIMKLDKEVSVAAGDQIIFEKVGAYSITLGGPFIRYYPKVLVKEENDYLIVRDEMNVGDYYSLHRSKTYRGIKNDQK
ncbi:diaminopimelate decarboxylase [Erysipelothrix rhusiopathiae]|nr:diaminopimelate decarboxylase [Erysipelothrix rhusiopathiae]